MRSWTLICFVLLTALSSVKADELNTILMQSTFKIVGQSRIDTLLSVGTVFFIIRPYNDTTNVGRILLITAAHVLDSIVSDTATIFFRKNIGNGRYQKLPVPVRIRKRGVPMWTHHPNPQIDIAAMKAAIPGGLNLTFLTTRQLASDSIVTKFELHPGDELLTLGFPFGIDANPEGFPILRSGKIASYPLVPSAHVRRILLDMNIYQGNSGGPVYFSYVGRIYQNQYHDEVINYVIGVVSQQGFSSPTHDTPLQIGIVIPAQFIVETIDLLK